MNTKRALNERDWSKLIYQTIVILHSFKSRTLASVEEFQPTLLLGRETQGLSSAAVESLSVQRFPWTSSAMSSRFK